MTNTATPSNRNAVLQVVRLSFFLLFLLLTEEVEEELRSRPIQRRHAASSAGVAVPSRTRVLMASILSSSLVFRTSFSFASSASFAFPPPPSSARQGRTAEERRGRRHPKPRWRPQRATEAPAQAQHQSLGTAAPRATLAPLAPSGHQGASPVEEPSVVATWLFFSCSPTSREQQSLPPPPRGKLCAIDLHGSTASSTVTPGSPHCSGRLSNKMATCGGCGGGGGTDDRGNTRVCPCANLGAPSYGGPCPSKHDPRPCTCVQGLKKIPKAHHRENELPRPNCTVVWTIGTSRCITTGT